MQQEGTDATISSDIPLSVDIAELPPVPSVPEADLWQRLRNGMKLADLDSPLVERQTRWFLNNRAFLETSFTRSRRYLHHVIEAIEARGMPSELALLPVIESAYDPRATSPQQASGIWQFIPSTGKVFGLKQNGWYDGRKDVVTATTAALDYLAKLQDMFGSWEIALAAYNCGEGCVTRAIQRNRILGRPTDYRSLDLPAETRNYVPRLLAVRNLVREPERFGLQLESLPNQPYFQLINLPYPIEARAAAKLAGMDMDELLALNPGFRRHVLHTESQSQLALPVDKLELFQSNMAAEIGQRARLYRYKAQKGELLSEIAKRFDVSLQWLKDHNPLDLNRGKMASTQNLVVPNQPRALRPSTLAQKTTTRKTRTHTIRRGDTLSGLARHYKVSVADIRQYNGRLKVLMPGATLQIPVES